MMAETPYLYIKPEDKEKAQQLLCSTVLIAKGLECAPRDFLNFDFKGVTGKMVMVIAKHPNHLRVINEILKINGIRTFEMASRIVMITHSFNFYADKVKIN